MKTILTHPVSLLVIISLAFCSCQKSQVSPIKSPASQTAVNKAGSGTITTTPTAPTLDTVTSMLPISQIFTKGTWRVSSYIEAASSSTSKFSSFIFTFQPDGTLIADEKGTITIGRWNFKVADFYYGLPPYGYSPDGFDLLIGSKRPLLLLSKNLFISKKTLTTVYLDSVNPAEDAHMTFSIN